MSAILWRMKGLLPRPIKRPVTAGLYVLGTAMMRTGARLAARFSGARPQGDMGLPASAGVWVDVGSWRGDFLASAPPGSRLYAFEPNLALAAEIQRRFPQATVVAAAASDRDGAALLHLTTDTSTYSLLPVDGERDLSFRAAGTRVVPTVRLDSFFQAAGITEVEMLAIDAQGADLDVLHGLGDCLGGVRRLRVEVHEEGRAQYQGASNLRPAVTAYLEERGFALVGEVPIALGDAADLMFEKR